MNRISLFLIMSILSLNCISQHIDVDLKYISPKPGSRFIMPGNNIALRQGNPFDRASISSSLLEVRSRDGKKIEGRIILSTDLKTLIYKPNTPFQLGETIYVKLLRGLKTVKNQDILPVEFEFTITKKIIQPKGFNPECNYYDSPAQNSQKFSEQENVANPNENNLPEGFPNININISNNPPLCEYYFIAPWTYSFYTDPYIIIIDASGIPIYYRMAEGQNYNFKVQLNGFLSFTELDGGFKNMIMDSSHRIIDYYQMGNGYPQTDAHDFLALENGHVFVLGQDWQIYAMDTVVPGGDPNAMVCGFIVQEQDADKNVIFQWRSWDHFLITDAGPQIDLTSYLVDYVHGNAVEAESDTSILISSRSLDEITKIHRNTGDIIWRFGGKKNQFDFQNDTLGFTMQHDCRKLQNGNFTLFDNGTMHPEPQFSSALEYELDEENFEATLIRRLRNDPDIYGGAMGSAQWTNDGAVVIGWGNGNPGLTEITPEGEVNMEIEFQGVSYRAFRFPWKTNYFSTDVDSLQFEIILPDSMIQEIEIYNNNEFEIEITSIYNKNPFFSSADEFPVIVPAAGTMPIYIKFKPDTAGTYSDVLTINSDINTDTLVQRIAQQIYLVGNATEGQGYGDLIEATKVIIYPNPADKDLIIEFPQKNFSGTVKLYDVYGGCVIQQTIDNAYSIELNLEHLPSGVYFVHLTEQYGTGNQFYKIIKN